MRHFFAYIRVSTVKQGEKGTSLQEQRDAIVQYARKQNLTIVQWFEEQETAAKQGRRGFSRMMAALEKGKASGLILHKIDRGARNLSDWAKLQSLIDHGVEVHFAHESLDLHTRGGRLSADIQAVVAADFIRNLRDETRKAMSGRFKQGLYPLAAPIGYLDAGGGRPKEIDPLKGPLVRRAFELYATGRFNLRSLRTELTRLGLRNRRDSALSVNGLSVMLSNQFYIGLVHHRRVNQTYQGLHRPLISKHLFDRVQGVLQGRINLRVQTHAFLFRRLLRCAQCGYALTGERQKEIVYYRCHWASCPRNSVREDTVETVIRETLEPIQFTEAERPVVDSLLEALRLDWSERRHELASTLKLRLDQINARITRLTDAYIDRMIDAVAFEERNRELLLERTAVNEELEKLIQEQASVPRAVAALFERVQSLWLSYESGLAEEKREILQEVTSNVCVREKNVVISLHSPFQEIATYRKLESGVANREQLRTGLTKLFNQIVAIVAMRPLSSAQKEEPVKPRRLSNIEIYNLKRERER